jgi:hypothetical protein
MLLNVQNVIVEVSRQRIEKLTDMFSQKFSQKFREDDVEVDRELRS